MPTFSQFNLDTVRRTQYAGTWYEGNSDKLKAQLRAYLHDADEAMNLAPHSVPTESILALIAPHAGYLYSGKTAAFSYNAIQSPLVKRVFLLGPSHHMALHGVALPSATSFETPLGNLHVDKRTLNELK